MLDSLQMSCFVSLHQELQAEIMASGKIQGLPLHLTYRHQQKTQIESNQDLDGKHFDQQ
jgi:hypothetical protein